jgi:predicted HTH domain antitoxin
MQRMATISKTDLARRTRQIVDRVRRGDTLIVESYGEEQIVMMDITDYRILRAVAAYHSLGPHPAPINDVTLEAAGLSQAQLNTQEADIQARWNQVIIAYLDGHINLGRAAILLNLSRYELDERFRRLDVPRRLGPQTVEQAQAEVDVARALKSQ